MFSVVNKSLIVNPIVSNVAKYLYRTATSTTNAANMSVTKVHARMIYDSRGNPTVEVDLSTDKGKQ